MPRWICPHCRATMNVMPVHIGTMQTCLNCKTTSEVTDADATVIPAEVPAFAVEPDESDETQEQSEKGVSTTTIGKIRKETPPIVQICRAITVVAAVIIVVGNLAAFSEIPNKTAGSVVTLAPAAMAVFAATLVWLGTDFVSDLYRCRRLLEEIAKK
jgi:hypothetical protein